MSSDNNTYWTKKSSRAIEPIVLAKKVNDDWLQSQVSVTHYHLVGALRQTLMDLLDISRSNGRSGTNLPTTSLRLMLQIRMQDVLTVDQHLGCKASNHESGLTFAVETLGQDTEDGSETLASIIREWAMSSLEPWSMDKNCSEVAMRVKDAAIADNVSRSVSQVYLREPLTEGVRFTLIARLLSDQLRGQELFEGLGPCEFVLPGAFNAGSFDLMSRPTTLPAQPGQGAHTFSMVARVQVSTVPCSRSIFVNVTPTKRVWSSTMPGGGNTGKKTTAYAFGPSDSGSSQFLSVIPLSVEKKKVGDAVRWEINGDEYAVVKEQAVLSGTSAPDTLQKAIEETAQDKTRWWIGLGQTTRLYSKVDQHTPTDTDESDLMERCATLWEGLADHDIGFEVRPMTLKRSSMTTMIRAEDFGTAGASLAGADVNAVAVDDEDDESVDSNNSNAEKIATFNRQCTRVLDKVHGDARPTLWLLGGKSDEIAVARKIVELLFGDRVEFRPDPLPANVHGLRADLPGKELPSKQRFNLRVASWVDAKSTGGLLDAIAAHPGPKYVLICAGKEIGNRTEDGVNRRAAIHAICARTDAAVHHVLPMETGNTDTRQAKARQNFIHRLQSAMTDVMLAHSGHLINAAAFAKNHLPDNCKAVYGIQALRKRAQMFSGETPVSMLVYTRINLATDTTEIQFCYGTGARTRNNSWMPLSEGLIWLAKQRDITSDEVWLRGNFETQTRKFLAETRENDPQAVVLVDWGTLQGLWRNLTDENLQNAPSLGNLPLAQAFPEMSFVRVRYGINAKVNVRGKSTSYYEAIRYEGTSKVLTGDTHSDEYTTTIQRLVEITEPTSGTYRAHHFIGMMTPRKTSPTKRGLSCFRSVTRMSKKVKDEEETESIFERGTRTPQPKDFGSPGAIDLSVLQHHSQVTPHDLATLVMGLRLGYPHYDEWTILPAPLFFLRKIDDYIIKYPAQEEAPALPAVVTPDSVFDADTALVDDSGPDAAPANVPVFEAVNQVVQAELQFELVEQDLDTQAAECPSVDAKPLNGIGQDNTVTALDLLATKANPVVGTASNAAKPPIAIPADNVWDIQTILKQAQDVEYIALIPFEGSSGLRKRKLLNAMIRGDVNLRVELPAFVNLGQFFSNYPKPDRKAIRKNWGKMREGGVVRHNVQQPQDYVGWLASNMLHPQGAYVIDSRILFGKTIILPPLDAIISAHNAATQDPEGKIYFDDTIDLEPVVRRACAENDDDTLSWLVFSAAQCPALGIYETVVPNITCVPGVRTQAALAYFLQCAYVVEQAMSQVSGTFNQSTSSVVPIQLKRPPQFALPSPRHPSTMRPISQAVALAYGDPLPTASPWTLSEEAVAENRTALPPCESPEKEVSPATKPSAPCVSVTVNPDVSVMKIKQDITQILTALEPGAEQFANDIEQIRTLLGELEGMDGVRRNERQRASQALELCNSIHAQAKNLLERIAAIDAEQLVKTASYQVVAITKELIDTAQQEIAQLEASVVTAEESDKQIQKCMNEHVPDAEKRRHARVLSALDIEQEGRLMQIQNRIWSSTIYTNNGDGGPDDPAGSPLPQALIPPAVEVPSATPGIEPVTVAPAVQAANTSGEQVAPVELAAAEVVEVAPVALVTPDIQSAPDAVTAEPQPEATLEAASENASAPEVTAHIEVKAVDVGITLTTPKQPQEHVEAPTPETTRKIVKEVIAGENKELGKALSHLRKLIDKRHYGIAKVYIEAISDAFKDQEDIQGDCALLLALCTELDAVDCNSMVQSRMSSEQSQVFDIGLFDGANSLTQAIGLLGAGLSGAIFFDPSSGNSDPLWSVLMKVQASLQQQPALAALIEHIASREKNAITLTQTKLVLSSASSEDRIAATLADYRQRAKTWVTDASMHTKWSHTGFLRAHSYIYSDKSSIGKCMALLAKDDVRGLKALMQETQGKFRKPKAVVEDAFRKIKDRTELNGGYLIHSITNINKTEEFLKDYLSLSEQKSQSGNNDFLMSHELEYIKALHATLKEACIEIDEIIVCGKTWTAIESIWLHAGRSIIQAVVRLFDAVKSDACIPSDIQRLLIQQPMNSDLMPSFKASGEYPPLLQASDVIESIDHLLSTELEDDIQTLDAQAMDQLLISAQEDHIANSRFLPAWRIEAMLAKPKVNNGADSAPTLLHQYSRACADLRRKLQELRQRVTHAMALSALGQKDANKMLHTISTIESVVPHLGKPDSMSPSFPDFPHAYFVINETITKVLDNRMQDATQRLQAELKRLRDIKGPDIRKDAERVEAMLATQKPADLRAAHDAMLILERGQKLPTTTKHRSQQTPIQFEEMTSALSLIKGSKESFIESLLNLLKNPDMDNALVSHLSDEERAEAATFVEHWIELGTQRGGNAAQMVSEMFEQLGLGVPQFTPGINARGNLPARLEFPPNPFVRLASECFIPPQLGSQQSSLPLYAIHGKHPENELVTLIHELASTPVVILARTTLTLQRRQRVIEKGSAIFLIDDFLIAFMALNPHDRSQKMLEIGLLNFHTNPYSADGAHVAREMFFGRQREIQTLHSVKNAAILYGGRRLGKSSLLAQIARDEEHPQSGKRALYIPMNKDYAGDDHVRFAWRTIYEHLVTSNVVRPMPAMATTAQGFADWIESSLIAGVDKIKHCYLLLDEADDLMAAELALAAGRVGFVRTLQNVSESLAPRGLTLRYCIAGLHNLARMTTEVNSALGKAETIALEPFTSAEDILRGIDLITKPMAALGFYFDSESADLPLRIMSVCNFYPAFIQIYCRKLLAYMYNKRGGKAGDSTIRLEDVERMENDDDLLSDLAKKFSMTLELDNRYKAIALVLADHYYREIENGTNEGATLQDIREMCETFVPAHFRNINTSAYESLLDEMRKLSVLDKSGNQYRLRNPSIAMLLGDKDRVESQIQDLAALSPSLSRNHGEKRIQMQPILQAQHGSTLPFFPMPISWIYANVAGRRKGDTPQTESTLPILCGNLQSGIEEISKPKISCKITQFDEYYCNPVNVSNMSSFLRTKLCTGLIPTTGGNLLLTTTEWRPSDISAFLAMAGRAAPTGIQLALLARPARAWDVANYMRTQSKENLLKKWNFVPIPTYSVDALCFHLGDNREVADSQQAREDILYATSGFARLIQHHCTDSLTVKKAAELRRQAEQAFGSKLSDFYTKIGLISFDIEPTLLNRIEATLAIMHNEPRATVSLDDINELTADNFKGLRSIDQYDISFMQWMGLLQDGPDAKWLVPPMYLRLIQS